MAMEEETHLPHFMSDYADLDLSFTSCTSASTAITDRTFATNSSSSARSSLARSSLTLSFNESRLSTTTASFATTPLHHRKWDPHWSAIKAATALSSDRTLHLRHLKLLRHVGTGNLGRVFLCRLRDDHNANAATFALKVVDKDSLTPKKQGHVNTEAQILSMLDHPFLPTLYARIDVSHYTCLLIDYCPNGDLHNLLLRQPYNRLPLPAVRFFAAEVLVALEYLHALGVVYRDLKPENILLREGGHIMLSDFDLCFQSDVAPTFERRRLEKSRPTKRKTTYSCFGSTRDEQREEMVAEFVAEPTMAYSKSCVGTHEYLAPEIISGKGHGNGVDWWAFGVLIYELFHGSTPFKGGTKESTLRNISASKGVRFHVAEEEEEGMKEARDLIERLLVRDPRRRLGCSKGATEIKQHSFFGGINWALIRTYMPPEIHGLRRKPSKAHGNVLNKPTQMRRKCWWKGLGQFVKSRYNKYNNNQNNNSNYHNYYVNSKMVRRMSRV